jgi:hypothetical protein
LSYTSNYPVDYEIIKIKGIKTSLDSFFYILDFVLISNYSYNLDLSYSFVYKSTTATDTFSEPIVPNIEVLLFVNNLNTDGFITSIFRPIMIQQVRLKKYHKYFDLFFSVAVVLIPLACKRKIASLYVLLYKLNIENGSSRCFTVSPFTGELNLLFEQ